MPVVRAQFWKGSSTATRDAIAASITQTMVDQLACPPQAVTVILEEIEHDHWYIGGTDAKTLTSGS